MNDPCFRSAVDLAAAIRRREVSATEVLDVHLERITQVNPRVNAIVTLTPEPARAAARALDARIARGEVVGPLAGLPIAHKDLVPTRGVRTTFGSLVFADHVPAEDAILVERTRAAGAIFVGKTNTPEFGTGSQTFNAVFGPTRNPYDLARTCGGSSGGAAVALATGMLPIADGSDLGGSLRNPASFCNVVGFRPSPGRVPTWPSVSSWFPLAVEGPMGRSVEDAALLFSVMAGPDARAPQSLPEPGARFRAPLDRDFRGARVGWLESAEIPVDARVRAVLAAHHSTFESLGCRNDRVDADFSDADFVFKTMRAANYALKLGETLKLHRDKLKQTVVWNIEAGLALTAADLLAAERARTALYQRLNRQLAEFDFVVLPAAQVPPFPVEQEYPTQINGIALGTYLDWMRACTYITVLGWPAISVPAGFTPEGLPVGLQIVGHHLDDFGVLQMGHSFEKATRFAASRPPGIAPG